MGGKRSRQTQQEEEEEEEEEERKHLELTELTLGDPSWRKIIKRLTKSDLNHLCRLILPTKQVQKHILPFIFSDSNKVDTDAGLPVKIIDEDDGSEHYLTFKKWSSSQSYVVLSNWNKEFVIRRELHENDWIQMYWSKFQQCFFFSALEPLQEEEYPLEVQPLRFIPPPMDAVIENERLQHQYPAATKKQKSTASYLFPNKLVQKKTNEDGLSLELTL